MVRLPWPASEQQLKTLLEDSTDGTLILILKLIRQEWAERIDWADSHGDGARVNALCWEARKWMSPGLRW
jgi:hypothetical protein